MAYAHPLLVLRSLDYLPLNDSGTGVAEPTEVRARVQRIGASTRYLVTVTPSMREPHRVTLYSAYTDSRKVPADVAAAVDAFNSDSAAGWDDLFTRYALRQLEAANDRVSAAEADARKWAGVLAALR
jgi:hypothetical protein